MTVTFRGLLAPTEVPTGDGRMFSAGKMTHRPTPLPMMARFGSGGHDGATPVAKINRIFDGPGGYWCEGEFLDPMMVPEVAKAIYMLQQKVMGPSVDLDRDFTTEVVPHPTRPDKKAVNFKEYNVIGATLVPMPAFHQVQLSVDNSEERALLASAGVDTEQLLWFFDVNGTSWRDWPVAPRNYVFDADDAVKRIAYWAGVGSRAPSIDRYASTFLWRNGNQVGDSLAQDSFRLPLADIINGQPYLVYHAVYSAAALLSGGHGGLPQVPDEDKANMVLVLNEIYSYLAGVFQDPNLKSPFLVGVRPEEMVVNSEWALDTQDCGCENSNVSESANFEGNVPETGTIAMPNNTVHLTAGGQTYVAGATSDALSTITVTFSPIPPDVAKSVMEEKKGPYDDSGCHFNEAGYCMQHYHMNGPMPEKPYGEVPYADPGYQADKEHRYPIDRASHIRAAWAYINMASNAAKYTLEQLKMIKDRIEAAAKEHGVDISSNDSEMAVAEGCYFTDGDCLTHFAAGDADKPYGDVKYADPGYQADGQYRYPIDTEAHIRAAWAYINKAHNAAQYNPGQLKKVKARIMRAAKEHGIEVAQAAEEANKAATLPTAPARIMPSVVAGAGPLAPPSAWFGDPALAAPTRLTVTDDGHVFGHLAQWRVCHVGIGNSCVIAPSSKTNYGLFKVGKLVCDDGKQVDVGKITLGTGHANAQWGVMPSREHYDNTGWSAAVVGVGEDRHGIWVNGALTTTMTPERIAELRAAALSGDWREVNGNLELIAALAVNNPGFPIYREANGRAFSLTAVGVVGTEDSEEEVSGEFSMGDNNDPVMNARAQRLRDIQEAQVQRQRNKRMALLAAIDANRDQIDIPSGRQQMDRFEMIADADFEEVPEESDAEVQA